VGRRGWRAKGGGGRGGFGGRRTEGRAAAVGGSEQPPPIPGGDRPQGFNVTLKERGVELGGFPPSEGDLREAAPAPRSDGGRKRGCRGLCGQRGASGWGQR